MARVELATHEHAQREVLQEVVADDRGVPRQGGYDEQQDREPDQERDGHAVAPGPRDAATSRAASLRSAPPGALEPGALGDVRVERADHDERAR